MIYVFGDCELDTRVYELRRAGQPLKLEPKVFDVLAYFVRHRDRMVTKQELFEQIWSDQFISDATLDHCISAARKAVGDSGRTQQIIKTLRGRGYRFVAPIEERPPGEAGGEVQREGQAFDHTDCPHCQHRHAGAARFCTACGAPLQITCPRCQHQNLPESKFCSSCGQALSETALVQARDEDAPPLTYTPRHLAEEILTTRSALEGERKQVTVMFCDLSGSTALAERLGPEVMHLLLNRFFELSLGAVHQYGGTINQFLGDGFMALFGAPLAHEDHARRAMLAALDLQSRLQEHQADFVHLQAGMAGATPSPIQVRTGLNTGIVVVGSIGDNLRMDYTAVGDTTNLAARLEQLADPGTIFIGESTTRLVRDEVELEALDLMSIRGKTAPVMVYKIVGRGPRRSVLETRLARGISRFVGRERELQTLHTLLAQVENGQGQAVGLVGEPGIGKSRLLHEFHKSLAQQPVTYLEGRCVSYGRTIPYLPVLDMLRHHCGITDSDDSTTRAEKISRRLQEAGMQPDEGLAYLCQFLGVKEGREHLAMLSSETIKSRTFDTLRRMSLKGSQKQPLIMVVEDLHWIDQSSEDFFASLVEGLAGTCMLLLTTYRPGYRPPWIGKSYATQIALQRLASSDSLAVVYSVLQQDALPHSLAQTILERADGNPLFLEELSRAMLEQGELRPDAVVPDTIQGVLTARIDRLPDDLKRLLQTASVLGRTFAVGLLRAIWEDPGGLEACLRDLKRLEFLYEVTEGEEPIYVFKHALTQEVAYDSLLITRRRLLHAAVGRAVEGLYAERLEEAYDRLAYHYSRTEQSEKAVAYLSRFAEKAAGEHAHVEAVMALQDALRHGERLPADRERQRLLLDLHLRLALSLSALGRYQEVLDHLAQQQDHLEQLQDAGLTGRYALLRGQTWSNLGDWQQAACSAQHAVEQANQCHDEATVAQAYHVLAMERYWAGQPQQGVEYSRQVVTLCERTGEDYRLGMAHFVLGLNCLMLGRFDQALEAALRAGAIGEAIADARLQTFAAWTAGWIHATRGAWKEAIAACHRALKCSSDPLNTAFATGWLGYSYLEQGDPTAAMPLLEQAVQRLRQYRYRRLEGLYTTFLGAAHLLDGRCDTARDLVLRGLSLASEETYHIGIGWAQRTLGHIAQAAGVLAEAESHLREALTTFTAVQAHFEIGRTHLDLAELAHDQGNRQAVTVHLTAAYHLFTVLRVPAYVERTAQRARALGLAFSKLPADP
jgi:class 3 adenylate cyclase/DNA-binding winged helix-turn-helix (wHTH) protein/tetratricopeptide (TPR) repeat protein